MNQIYRNVDIRPRSEVSVGRLGNRVNYEVRGSFLLVFEERNVKKGESVTDRCTPDRAS